MFSGPRFNIKTAFTGMGIPMVNKYRHLNWYEPNFDAKYCRYVAISNLLSTAFFSFYRMIHFHSIYLFCFRKLPLTILCATIISRSEKLKEGGKNPSLQPLVKLVRNLSQTPVKSLDEMSFTAICFTEIKHQLSNSWITVKDLFIMFPTRNVKLHNVRSTSAKFPGVCEIMS